MKAERALQEEEEGERDELLRLRVRGEADYAQVGVNEVDAKSLPPPTLSATKVGLGGLFPLRPNADFPAMSECLEVVFEPGRGRHVIAKCDIQERFRTLTISLKDHLPNGSWLLVRGLVKFWCAVA